MENLGENTQWKIYVHILLWYCGIYYPHIYLDKNNKRYIKIYIEPYIHIYIEEKEKTIL